MVKLPRGSISMIHEGGGSFTHISAVASAGDICSNDLECGTDSSVEDCNV